MTKNVENAYNNISNKIKRGERKMCHKSRSRLNRKRCYCETNLSQEEIKKMIEQGALLVDVRSPQEFAEGHLEKAICLPEYEIKQRANQTLPNKLQTIIVYCSTGHRSQKAQKTLQTLGYKNVYNLCKGIENYN